MSRFLEQLELRPTPVPNLILPHRRPHNFGNRQPSIKSSSAGRSS